MFLELSERKCVDIGEALGREWLEVNSRGSYASSSLLNCNTRRYHGLLVVQNENGANGDRLVTLSKYEESLAAMGKEFHLACHQYPNFFFPAQGHCLRGFRLDPVPHFIYKIGDVTVHKRILLASDENMVMVRYEIQGADFPMSLRIRPLLAFRGQHSLMRRNDAVNVLSHKARNGFWTAPYSGLSRLYVQSDQSHEFFAGPDWFCRFEYLADRARGYDFQEDLYTPGILLFDLSENADVIVAASLTECAESLETVWEREMSSRIEKAKRATESVKGVEFFKDGLEALIRSGESFLVRPSKSGGLVVNSGYYWFGVTGRDALIALPGLTGHAECFDKGIEILASLAEKEKDGLLPNLLSVGAEGYNSADTSLWFFWAVQRMLEAAPDRKAFLRTVKTLLWPAMKRIISGHVANASPEVVAMEESGLLKTELAMAGMTWMDSGTAEAPVVARRGLLVEVNALWYNALCFAEELSASFADHELRLDGFPGRVAGAFVEAFWMPNERFLGDSSWKGVMDASVRPNQIIAASVPYSPLSTDLRMAVVERVAHELLTPFGLRSLSPREQGYAGRCQSGASACEYARHQGAAWPWLLCHYAEAMLRDSVDGLTAKRELRELIAPLVEASLSSGCLGVVGEFFDGDPGQSPAGGVASARNTGELIRLLRMLQ